MVRRAAERWLKGTGQTFPESPWGFSPADRRPSLTSEQLEILAKERAAEPDALRAYRQLRQAIDHALSVADQFSWVHVPGPCLGMLRHILDSLDARANARVLPILRKDEAYERTKHVERWYRRMDFWGWQPGMSRERRITALTCLGILLGVPWLEGNGPTFNGEKTYAEYFDDERRLIKRATEEWASKVSQARLARCRARRARIKAFEEACASDPRRGIVAEFLATHATQPSGDSARPVPNAAAKMLGQRTGNGCGATYLDLHADAPRLLPEHLRGSHRRVVPVWKRSRRPGAGTLR